MAEYWDSDDGPEPCLPYDEAGEGEIDWTQDPDTPEEYLRRVRAEAKQLGNVLSTSTRGPPTSREAAGPSASTSFPPPPSSLPQAFRDILSARADPDTPLHLLPSTSWVSDFFEDFSHLRSLHAKNDDAPSTSDDLGEYPLLSMEGKSDEDLLQMCIGASAAGPGPFFGSSVLLDSDDGWTKPLTPTLHAMDRVQTNRLLHLLMDFVCERRAVDDRVGAWLFALLARVDVPLDEDMYCALRALVKVLLGLRAEAQQGGAAISRINVLLAVAGGYFGQEESLAGIRAEMGLNAT